MDAVLRRLMRLTGNGKVAVRTGILGRQTAFASFEPLESFFLLLALLFQAFLFSTFQLFRWNWFSAARLWVSVVCRSSGTFLRVLAFSPFRSKIGRAHV